jgi:hypothetical protein
MPLVRIDDSSLPPTSITDSATGAEYAVHFVPNVVAVNQLCKNAITLSTHHPHSQVVSQEGERATFLVWMSQFDDALLHWLLECAVFFELFAVLRDRVCPNLRIWCKGPPRPYHATIAAHLGISADAIVYSISQPHHINNLCIVPHPDQMLNDDRCSDAARARLDRLFARFAADADQQHRLLYDVVVLPRQQLHNNVHASGQRRSDCSDIVCELLARRGADRVFVLHTDRMRSLQEQLDIVRSSSCMIVTDGSPFLFNALAVKGCRIVVLGDTVLEQARQFIKMKYLLDYIESRNDVVYVPYVHGTFENARFFYSQIESLLLLSPLPLAPLVPLVPSSSTDSEEVSDTSPTG